MALQRLRLRLRTLFSPDHDRELRHELQAHIDLLTDEFLAQGLPLTEARARAHREFGNATRVQEASHDLFSLRFLEGTAKDLGYALREVRRSPGFTAVAICSLAVGIGVVTATFTIVDALMLRGLSVRDPQRLVAFSAATSTNWSRWPYATFRQWATAPDATFDVTAIYDLNDLEQPPIPTALEKPRLSLVSGRYFEVLGVPMAAGRAFTPAEDRFPGAPHVAVISYGFWERQFGLAANVVGTVMEINGGLFEIIGVARRGFTGDWVGQPTDLWLPLGTYPAITGSTANLLSEQSTARRLRVIGRLRDDVTTEQATAAANLLFQRWRATQPQSAQAAGDRSEHIALLSAARGYAPLRQRYAQPLMIVSAIVVLVLVVACSNFTNLLYGRSRSRQQEFAVRLVMGAGRWRIIRQSVTECVLLASVAGIIGVVLSSWATTGALKRFAATIQPLDLDLRVDARVVAFAATCIALVIAFGLAPCIRGSRFPEARCLSQAEARERRRNITGRLILVGQLALCAVLLIGAGLMLRSVDNLRSQSLGFDRNVLLVTVSPGRETAGAIRLQRVREQLQAIRGVSAVSTTGSPLLDTRAYWIDGSERLAVDGREPVAGIRWTFADVGPAFFETIGMPVIRGRGIDEGDFNPPSDAVVINQTLATLLFGPANPIGRRIGLTASSPRLTIVGVVNDARQTSPRDRGLGVLYRPLHQLPQQVVLAVRTTGPPADLVDVVQHQLAGIDRLGVIAVRTVESLLNDAIAQERLLGTLAAWLGALVILVACVGLHALVSNDVAQRTHEMGVRLALGATRRGVALLVLRDCLVLVGLSLAIGVPLSLAATRPLSSQLYGLRADDPQTIGAVAFLLVTIALAAAGRPAHSAARVDPVVLLRAD